MIVRNELTDHLGHPRSATQTAGCTPLLNGPHGPSCPRHAAAASLGKDIQGVAPCPGIAPEYLCEAHQSQLRLSTSQDVKNHTELDSSFEKVKLAVMQHVSLLQRQAQVRVKNWLKKLSEEVSTWFQGTHLQL